MGTNTQACHGKAEYSSWVGPAGLPRSQATENENKQLSASEDRAVEEGLLRSVRDAGRKKKKAKSKKSKSLGKKKKKSKKKNRPAKKSGKKARKGKEKKKKKKKKKK